MNARSIVGPGVGVLAGMLLCGAGIAKADTPLSSLLATVLHVQITNDASKPVPVAGTVGIAPGANQVVVANTVQTTFSRTPFRAFSNLSGQVWNTSTTQSVVIDQLSGQCSTQSHLVLTVPLDNGLFGEIYPLTDTGGGLYAGSFNVEIVLKPSEGVVLSNDLCTIAVHGHYE